MCDAYEAATPGEQSGQLTGDGCLEGARDVTDTYFVPKADVLAEKDLAQRDADSGLRRFGLQPFGQAAVGRGVGHTPTVNENDDLPVGWHAAPSAIH